MLYYKVKDLNAFKDLIEDDYIDFCEKYISKLNFGLVNIYDKVKFVLLKRIIDYFRRLYVYDINHLDEDFNYRANDRIIYQSAGFLVFTDDTWISEDLSELYLPNASLGETIEIDIEKIKKAITVLNYLLKTNYDLTLTTGELI